ncbi:peroxide stress protein YaaA [Myroides sp. LJL119]
MKILISPAKSLDYTTKVPTSESSQAEFIPQAEIIQEVLEQKTVKDLESLMKISPALAELNYHRNQNRSFRVTSQNKQEFRQAVFAFNGDVYTGLDAYNLDPSLYEDMQDKLRILSGLYGMLKPFDLIEPYRLEMGTKMAVGQNKDLYSLWKPILAQALNQQTQEGQLIVNLASNEYFSAIDKKALKGTLINIDFKELRDGKLKIVSFFAKKARGTMVRYILENKVQDLQGLKAFNLDGYACSEQDSKENHLVFTR